MNSVYFIQIAISSTLVKIVHTYITQGLYIFAITHIYLNCLTELASKSVKHVSIEYSNSAFIYTK